MSDKIIRRVFVILLASSVLFIGISSSRFIFPSQPTLHISYEVKDLNKYYEDLQDCEISPKYSETYVNRVAKATNGDAYCIGDTIYTSGDSELDDSFECNCIYTADIKDYEVFENVEDISQMIEDLTSGKTIYISSLQRFIVPTETILKKFKKSLDKNLTMKSLLHS